MAGTLTQAQSTYTWIGSGGTGGSGTWNTSTHWSPTRSSANAADVLLFNAGATANISVTGTSLVGGQIIISNNSNITLTSSSTFTTRTISVPNGTGDDLVIEEGSSLTLSTRMTVTLATNASADISGGMTITNGTDRVFNLGTTSIANISGTLTVQGTFNLTTSATVTTVTGTLINGGGTLSNFTAARCTIAAGGTYRHALNGGTVPAATWDANSTIEFTGITSTTPTGLGQTFGNFIWNCSGHSGNLYIQSNMTVSGDFTISATGSYNPDNNSLRMSNTSTGYTINVLGNFNLNNNTSFKMNNSTGSCILNIGGDLNISGTTPFFCIVTGGANSTVNVSGSANISAGTLRMNENNSNTGFLNVAGNFSHTAGTIDNSGASSIGSITFNGLSPQTFISGGTISGIINYSVNSGASLMLGNNLLGNGSDGTFTLNAGATLGIGHASGITTSGTSSNVRVTGTRTYNTGANYIYNGSAAQITGAGLPASVNNLTIDNAADVTLTSGITINGTLTFTSGKLNTGANTLSLGAAGSVTGETDGSYLVGNLTVTRVVDGSESVQSFDGVGVTIDPGSENLGSTTVQRVSGSSGIVSANSNEGIARTWIITPTNDPSGDVFVTLTWVSDDNNNVLVPADYKVYHSPDGNEPWEAITPTAFSNGSVTFAVSEFSYFTVGDGINAPLPVELTSFTAVFNKTVVSLNWTTATETQNFGFEVERIHNDGKWQKIGFVPGNGNSNSPKEYSFVDKNIIDGTYTYRLKQIDNDGGFSYSQELKISVDKVPSSFGLKNYPNPFNPTTNIVFELPSNANVTLSVFNILGQRVFEIEKGQMEAGVHTHVFDGSNLSSGTYIYLLEAGSVKLTKTFTLIK